MLYGRYDTILLCLSLFLVIFSCGGKIRPTIQEEEDITAAGVVIQQADFQTALDELQAAHSDAIGAPKVCVYGALKSCIYMIYIFG